MVTSHAHSNTPHLLIVDAKPDDLSSLVEAARSSGWQVSLATSGKRGLHLALATRVDVVLLDTHLPDVSGFSVCRLLHESPEARSVPVMFVTRASTMEERLEGLTCGAVDYLLKSCAPEEILARIRIHTQRTPRTSPDTRNGRERLPYDQLVLQAAMRFIRNRMSTPPSLDEIAHHVGVYDKKLSEIFRRHLGITVFVWIREERIRLAKQLLVDTGLSVQDIADAVGFNSSCNFITAFREHTGHTPNRYRKDGARLRVPDLPRRQTMSLRAHVAPECSEREEVR
jgi:DNA-binding response OmpR family regulator